MLAAAVLLAGSTGSAQSQAPDSPSKTTPSRSLPLTEFYDVRTPLPPGKPGELIRSERSDEYRLSYQVTAYRLLYHSRSPNEEDVAVSGVALLPGAPPPAGGWPIIAWAHGFNGAARRCAPSLLKNLHEGPLLAMYVGLGYAVVASDYAGLGTNFPHAAFDVRSNATDVINAIAAARAALPQLGSRWIVAGYEFGSLVAVAVAESENTIRDPDYWGAIGISGVAEPPELFEGLALSSSYPILVFLAKGIKAVYPDFRVEGILTEKAIPLYEYVDHDHSCDATSGPVPLASDLLRPGWVSNRFVREFFARNTLAQRPARGSLLLIAGENDTVVPYALTVRTVARLCAQKDKVLFVKYPALNSSAVVENSIGEQVSWIKARFSGFPAPSNCP